MCIDSTCIIDFLKGKESAIKIVEKYKDSLVTTEINLFEIYFGIYQKKEISEKEKIAASLFFDNVELLGEGRWGEVAAELMTNSIKKGKIIDQNDCFIAAIMKQNGCNKIITSNEKYFSNIEGIEVIKY